MAGRAFYRDAIFEGPEGLNDALQKACGAVFNHFDNPKCALFETQIQSFIEQCRDNEPDQAFLYMCTHGKVNPDTGELHLMMNDSKNPTTDPKGFFETSVDGRQLRGDIKRLREAIPNGKVFVFLDCCKSGALYSPQHPQTLGTEGSSGFGATSVRFHPGKTFLQEGSGTLVFMSSGPNEASGMDGSDGKDCPAFSKALSKTLLELPNEPMDLGFFIPKVIEKVQLWKGNEQNPCTRIANEAGFGNFAYYKLEPEPEDMDIDER